MSKKKGVKVLIKGVIVVVGGGNINESVVSQLIEERFQVVSVSSVHSISEELAKDTVIRIEILDDDPIGILGGIDSRLNELKELFKEVKEFDLDFRDNAIDEHALRNALKPMMKTRTIRKDPSMSFYLNRQRVIKNRPRPRDRLHSK